MDLYHTTDTDGVSDLNPCEIKMREIIAQLDEPGAEESNHPDVSLVHDPSGWSVSLFPSGIATLENLDEEDSPPRYLNKLNRQQALQLWKELAQGKIEYILQHPWMHERA